MQQVKKWLGLGLWAKGAPCNTGGESILPPMATFFLSESVKARGQFRRQQRKQAVLGLGMGGCQQWVAGDFNSQIFLWATFTPSPTKRLCVLFLSLHLQWKEVNHWGVSLSVRDGGSGGTDWDSPYRLQTLRSEYCQQQAGKHYLFLLLIHFLHISLLYHSRKLQELSPDSFNSPSTWGVEKEVEGRNLGVTLTLGWGRGGGVFFEHTIRMSGVSTKNSTSGTVVLYIGIH